MPSYRFWKRFSGKKDALEEAKKLRKMGKPARVKHATPKLPYNWDVEVKV